MAASIISVSAEENLGDPIDIRVDIIHPEPVAAVAFPAAAIVRTQAQHGEAIRGIQEHLLGVPTQEENRLSECPIVKFQNHVDMIQGRVMASKPKIMQDANEIATELIGKKISTLAEHQAENKRKLDNNNQAQQQHPKKNLTCYECGNQGHYKSDCPERKNQNHENQTRGTGARGVVHALGRGETDQDPNNIEDEIEA
ncbi:reverse transcriptase domain-containing protein [Tanacetum coccineum]|uniref:Reverse transcriptase domain-containing protein n=1 Tax=Tanacetum coccineum TaxID=301880 RepID=A0ABQ5AQB5_9ASTR